MKFLLKRLILFLSIIIVSPFILLARIGLTLESESIFGTFACALSLIPGKIGSYIRLAYYKGTLKKISSNVVISFGSFFSNTFAEIGNNVYIGAYCIIGNVTLKDDVLIASRVSIPSGKNQHADYLTNNSRNSKPEFNKVTIGNKTWIGEGAIVMANVGDRCIIGSGSIVSRPIPSDTVAVGNPAKPIKNKAEHKAV